MGVSFVTSQQAWNFVLYSKHASAVTLHLYQRSDTENPVYSYQFKPLPNKSGRVWHCRISVAAAASAHFCHRDWLAIRLMDLALRTDLVCYQ